MVYQYTWTSWYWKYLLQKQLCLKKKGAIGKGAISQQNI